MITLVTKIPIKPLSLLEFHDLLSNFHSLVEYSKAITKMDNGYIVCDSNVVGYHIEDKCIYEYIYDEKTNELFISLDKKSNEEAIDLLDYLIKNDLILKDNDFKIKDIPHYMKENRLPKTSILPCVYFNEQLAQPNILNECSKLLKGMAHVLYGNPEVDELMKKHHHSNYQSYAILYNNDYIGFSKFKNETEDAFIKRVYYKMQTYMTKRVFETPFNMNNLYQKALSKMIDYYKNNEELILLEYDDKLKKLENDKKEYIKSINDLNNQIEYFKYEIESYQEKVNSSEKHPLLFKGEINEFYEGEQKDIVLALICEELKTEKDPMKVQLYNEILQENPEVGKRRKYLDEIWSILLSSKQIGSRQTGDLRKIGITLVKGETHIDCSFYDTTRYFTSLSSSPSDTNTNRQVYRTIRNHFYGNLNDKYNT